MHALQFSRGRAIGLWYKWHQYYINETKQAEPRSLPENIPQMSTLQTKVRPILERPSSLRPHRPQAIRKMACVKLYQGTFGNKLCSSSIVILLDVLHVVGAFSESVIVLLQSTTWLAYTILWFMALQSSDFGFCLWLKSFPALVKPFRRMFHHLSCLDIFWNSKTWRSHHAWSCTVSHASDICQSHWNLGEPWLLWQKCAHAAVV